MKAVCKFYWEFRRSGNSVEGLFIADSDDVKWVLDNKVEVDLGEAAGKHSEVFGPLEGEEITIVSTDVEVVEIIEKHAQSGYNPFDYPCLGSEVLGIENLDDETVQQYVDRNKK